MGFVHMEFIIRHIACTLHDKLQRQWCPAPIESMLNYNQRRDTNEHAQLSGDISISVPWNSNYEWVEDEGVCHIFL